MTDEEALNTKKAKRAADKKEKKLKKKTLIAEAKAAAALAMEQSGEQQTTELAANNANTNRNKATKFGAPLGSLKALYINALNAPAPILPEDVRYLKNNAEWAPGVSLSALLKQALDELGFQTPTPIQTAAIPLVNQGDSDIVGAAETGSGKTLVSWKMIFSNSSFRSKVLFSFFC